MQLTQMRVEDELAFGPENLGVPSGEIEERVTWALEAVGLAGYHDRSPLLLSGGEKQRVAIAAMLAMRPQVLGPGRADREPRSGRQGRYLQPGAPGP